MCGTGPDSELSPSLSTVDKPGAAPTDVAASLLPGDYGSQTGDVVVKWAKPSGDNPVRFFFATPCLTLHLSDLHPSLAAAYVRRCNHTL